MEVKLANRFIELRKAHELSQEQLAEHLHVSRQAVSKWERGESSPDTANLMALAKLYGISLDELLDYHPENSVTFSDYGEEEAEEQASPVPEKKPISWAKFPYPIIVAIVFCLMGSLYDLWHPGWMLFLTIPMYYTAIEGDHFNLSKIPFPLIVTPLYLMIGFAWDLWHPGWILFLTIPLYYWLDHVFPSVCGDIMEGIAAVGVYLVLAYIFGRENITWLVIIVAMLGLVYIFGRGWMQKFTGKSES